LPYPGLPANCLTLEEQPAAEPLDHGRWGVTVHFVGVHGCPVDSTSAIVLQTVDRLKADFDFVVHHPNDPVTIKPSPGDILIGHPNRYGDCAFRRSFAQPGWARRIVFAPFSLGVLKDAACIDDLVVEADLYLATSGPGWWKGLENSVISHWRHKMLPFELGIDRNNFPAVRSRFNPPGQRRFLYIGNADRMKGGDYLAALADANPDLHFGWVRTGDSRHCLDWIPEMTTPAIRRRMERSRLNIAPLLNWRGPEGLQITATYDFVINCGRSDAMPCEILECAAWGLVPVTTPQCGYEAGPWLTHIPLDDIAGASAILHDMNLWSDAEMKARQAIGWNELDTRYTWDRAAAQLRHALECPLPEPDNSATSVARAESNREALRQVLRDERRADMRLAVLERLETVSRLFSRPAEGWRRAG